jgi:hypothetical protein
VPEREYVDGAAGVVDRVVEEVAGSAQEKAPKLSDRRVMYRLGRSRQFGGELEGVFEIGGERERGLFAMYQPPGGDGSDLARGSA